MTASSFLHRMACDNALQSRRNCTPTIHIEQFPTSETLYTIHGDIDGTLYLIFSFQLKTNRKQRSRGRSSSQNSSCNHSMNSASHMLTVRWQRLARSRTSLAVGFVSVSSIRTSLSGRRCRGTNLQRHTTQRQTNVYTFGSYGC